VDADNASTLVLINNKDTVLTLNHWTSYNFDDEVYVFNGELELESSSNGAFYDVGFCMQMDEEDDLKWDCY